METFAVALVGEEDRGWLVEAAPAEEAIDIVHGTVPRAHEAWRGERLVWTAEYYRETPSRRDRSRYRPQVRNADESRSPPLRLRSRRVLLVDAAATRDHDPR